MRAMVRHTNAGSRGAFVKRTERSGRPSGHAHLPRTCRTGDLLYIVRPRHRVLHMRQSAMMMDLPARRSSAHAGASDAIGYWLYRLARPPSSRVGTCHRERVEERD